MSVRTSVHASRHACLHMLEGLDRLLQSAVATVGQQGRSPGEDPFAGLYLTRAQIERSFDHEAGMPEFAVEQTRGHEPEAFAVLRAACGLSDFDLDVIRLALAPEIDARYERIYAFCRTTSPVNGQPSTSRSIYSAPRRRRSSMAVRAFWRMRHWCVRRWCGSRRGGCLLPSAHHRAR